MGDAGTSIMKAARWRRNLLVTWLAEFMAVLAFTTVKPFLPLYVQELMVGGEQETRLWAGVVVAAPALTMALFAPLWGVLGDRHGRKVMVIRALLGGALTFGLMAAVGHAQQLAFLRLLQGALAGSVTAANVLVVSMAPRRRVGHTLGLLWVAVYAGSSAGPVLGGVVADSLGFRAACYGAGALLLLAGILVTLFVRETGRTAERRQEGVRRGSGTRATEGRSEWTGLRQLLLVPTLASVLGARLLVCLAAQVLAPVLPFFVAAIESPGAPVASITGLVSGAGAAAGAVGALWLGRLGDRTGHRAILVCCAVVAALAHLPQAFVEEPVALVALCAVSGLASGGIMTSITASLARLSPEGREGVVYGVEGTATSIANGVGPLVGSLSAAWLGLRLPFLIAGGLYGLAAVITRGRPRAVASVASGEPAERGRATPRVTAEAD